MVSFGRKDNYPLRKLKNRTTKGKVEKVKKQKRRVENAKSKTPFSEASLYVHGDCMKAISIILFSLIILIGCNGKESEDSSKIEVYDENIYNLDKHGVAILKSGQQEYLNTPPGLNDWSITSMGRNWAQIGLTLVPYTPEREYGDFAIWALYFTSVPDIHGSISYDELDIKLFYRYQVHLHIDSKPPYITFGGAKESYLPVSGYVDFESLENGFFSLDFQKESAVGSGITTGKIVNLRGCWSVGINREVTLNCESI